MNAPYPPLTTYYVYLTEGCNLACKHCWLSPRFLAGGENGGYLDFDLFALALREGKALGLSHVKLTGGEPLLHPDFHRMVRLLRQQGIGLTIETNGTLLDRQTARFLKAESTLGFISISIDGESSESHDAFRGVKGSFEKSCQALRYLADEGYRPQVIMSVHKGNKLEAEGLVKLADKLGAGSVKLGLVTPSGRGDRMAENDEILGLEELIAFGEWTSDYLVKQTSIPIFYNWPAAFFPLKDLMNYRGFSCNIHNILGILHDGQLSLCGIGTQEPELCFGKIGEDSIADIWQYHHLLKKIREEIPDKLEGVCAECIFRTRCRGYCVAQNFHVSRRLTAPFWICQQADDTGLFPATRKINRASSVVFKKRETQHEVPETHLS